MRFQNSNYARYKAIIALVFVFVALIISPGIVQSRAQVLAPQGPFSRATFANRLNHGMYAIPAAYVTMFQDAGQAATPPDPSSTVTPAPATPPQPKKVELPEGEGKSLALDYCQDCHRLTNLSRSHKSPEDWKETVDTMVDRGARLPPENVDALVQYLAKNFGPKTDTPATAAAPAASVVASPAPAVTSAAPAAPVAAQTAPAPAKKVELPEGDGKAIATENCQACHKLTNLTRAHKSLDEWRDTVKTMMDRGAEVPADQLETLVQYLAKNFGPKAADAGAVAPTGGAAPAPSSPSQ